MPRFQSTQRFGPGVRAIALACALAVVGSSGYTSHTGRAAHPAHGVTPAAIAGRLPHQLLIHPKRLALRPRFRHWAGAYQVPSNLVEGLAWMESGWQNKVTSRTGAIGIGQLEPSTVKFVCNNLLHTRLDPHVADANIAMTSRYLRYLLDQTHGDVVTAVAAYYQGMHSLAERGPLPETRRYVSNVLALSASFSPG